MRPLLKSWMLAAFVGMMLLANPMAAASPATASHPAGGSSLTRDPRMVLWRQTFFWAVVLIFIFVIAAGAIIRFSQRFRTMILTGPARPTPSEDVWAMHKAPEKLEFDEDEP